MTEKTGALGTFTLAEADNTNVLDKNEGSKIPIGELGIRNTDIDAALADVESITGQPVKGTGKRGRKKKADSESTDKTEQAAQALNIAGIDAKQIEGTLTEVYLQGLALLARCPVNVTDDKKKTIGPLITACANQYIPGDYLKHAALVGLVVVSFDIVRESRKTFLGGESKDG